MGKIELSIHKWEQETSELNERMKERIGNSRDRKHMEEEWEKKLKQLEGEVEEGIRKRKSLEEKVKREQEYQEQLRKEASLEYDEMSRKRDEMCKKRDEEGEERWKKKNFRDTGAQSQREGTTKRDKGKKVNGE